MSTTQLIPMALKALTPDAWLLFVTRFARLFAYGSLSVILVFYLLGLGLTEVQSGLVLTLTLAGDVVVSLLLTAPAHVGHWRHSHGCCGPCICVHAESFLPDPCGYNRRHQS